MSVINQFTASFTTSRPGMPLRSLLAVAVAAAGMSAGAAQAETLNIVSWGGAYTDSQNKAYHEPWD